MTERDRSARIAVRIPWLALAVAWLALTGVPALAQEPSAGAARSADGLWQPATDQALDAARRRTDLTGGYRVLQLSRAALDGRLAQAPDENALNRGALAPVVISLPLPDGRFSRFRVEESPILAPELAARFPQIKTYRGIGLDDPTATARMDLTEHGFHAQIIASGGTVYVDPYRRGDLVNHVTYDKQSARPRDVPFADFVDQALQGPGLQRLYNELPIANGTILRTYRLALAATGEYTALAGGTKPAALSRMTTTINRVSGIYERDIAVRFTLVTGTTADPTALIYLNGVTDPYSNDDGFAMLSENQTNLDTVMAATPYDVGHVFSTGGGGVASLGVVCSASSKARGVTGSSSPTGDAFDVDYVAHEIGHQFAGNHTFDGTTNACGGGNRSDLHAYEVGSGSTIMAYAGICGGENTQPNSHDIFNFESLNEVTAFITSGGGSTCGSTAATGNLLPVVSGPGPSFSVPRDTPFALTAAASDGNGDALTFLWEEHDLDAGTGSNTSTAATDNGSRPLFRSYAPTSSPTRTFPSLPYILNNANVPPRTYLCSGSTCLTGEILPSTTRTMRFMVTVRDNRANGGGINTGETQIVVNGTIGPFAVTSPNTAVTWTGTTAQTVTWSVNGSQALAASVQILLSTDGGLTFPVVLAASTANDGSELVTVPNSPTSTARIKVQAVGNVFFDISNTNFTVAPGGPPPGAFSKTAPADGATGQALSPTLSWGSSTGATSYEYCVDTTSNATCNTGWTSAGAATSVVLSNLLPGVTYSWQVRAVNVIGTTEADANTWRTFTTQALSNPDADLAVDFGPIHGLWAYYDGGSTPAWQHLHGASPGRLAEGDVDGNGRTDLILTFAGFGTWVFLNNSTFVQLHPLEAGLIETGDLDGNGRDEIVVTFAGFGTWIYYDGGSWSHLHALAPNVMTVGNIDGSAGGRADVILSFGTSGIWAFSNNAAWSQVHPLGAVDVDLGDVDGNGTSDLIVQFAGFGEYVLYNSTAWTPLHPAQAAGFATGDLDGNGQTDIVVNFPGFGVWTYMNNSSWVQRHLANAPLLTTADLDGNGVAEIVLDFTGFGVWSLTGLTTWSQIHPIDAEAFVSGRMNAN